jgi:hypothetical protein
MPNGIKVMDMKNAPPDLGWVGMDAKKILDLYGQQVYWVDWLGKHHFISEMDTNYLWNLMDFLRRNAPLHLFRAAWAMVPPNGAPWQVELEWEKQDDEWIAWQFSPWDTPLARGIAAELASRATSIGNVNWTSISARTYTRDEIKAFKEGR